MCDSLGPKVAWISVSPNDHVYVMHVEQVAIKLTERGAKPDEGVAVSVRMGKAVAVITTAPVAVFPYLSVAVTVELYVPVAV
jgi:hypothetical protein